MTRVALKLVAADDDGDSEDPFLDIIATHGLPS